MSALTTQRTRYFDLPPVRTDSRPQFTDLASARRWAEELETLPPAAANGLLYTQIATFTNTQANPDSRYAILDFLRPHVFRAQTDHAMKFRGKPLPLSPQRREALSEVASLWDALARGYQRCLEQLADRETTAPDLLAGACERALDCVSRKIREHHFAYVQVTSNDFRLLHRLYQYAEKTGIVRHRVRDTLATSQESTTCMRTYARAILLDASMPREHRIDRLAIIEHWIDRWINKVTVHQDSPRAGESSPLYVNLNRDLGARREPENGPNVRFVDVSTLGQSIAKRIHLLRHGKKPEDIELGNQLNRRDAENLLVALHRQWCEGSPRRVHERTSAEQLAHISPGLVAARFYVAKQPFTQPFQSVPPSPSADERVKAATDYLTENGIRAEQWIIRDESLTGLGLVRPLGESDDSRLVHGQLITIRRRGGGAVWVGTIQWLQEALNGDLLVGARLVPGIPSAISIRRLGEDAFVPALLLDPIPALNAPTSLLVPFGTFAPQRVVEVHRRGIERLQLTGLLEAGGDYERVAFMPVGR